MLWQGHSVTTARLYYRMSKEAVAHAPTAYATVMGDCAPLTSALPAAPPTSPASTPTDQACTVLLLACTVLLLLLLTLLLTLIVFVTSIVCTLLYDRALLSTPHQCHPHQQRQGRSGLCRSWLHHHCQDRNASLPTEWQRSPRGWRPLRGPEWRMAPFTRILGRRRRKFQPATGRGRGFLTTLTPRLLLAIISGN